MKAEDLKFPMVLEWYGITYVVEEVGSKLNWTELSGANAPFRYTDSAPRSEISDALNSGQGKARILAYPPSIQPIEEVKLQEPVSLQIKVDSTEVVSAKHNVTELTEALNTLNAAIRRSFSLMQSMGQPAVECRTHGGID